MSVIIWAQFWVMAFAAGVAIVREHWLDVIEYQADNPESVPGRDVPRAHSGPAGGEAGSWHGWLPFTPQLRTSPPQLRRPRVCGGRLATVADLAAVSGNCDWLLASRTIGPQWPLQEGTA